MGRGHGTFARGSAQLGGLALLILTMVLGVFPALGQTPKLKLAAALPGIITDKGWNQAAYEALKKMEKDMGAQIAYTERVAQPDQVEVMSDYARRGFTMVFGHGGEFDAAGKQVAERFPKTKVVITAGTVTGPNLASVQINVFQMGFLAGVVAGGMTKTGKIAAIVAQKFKSTDDMQLGYEQGAKYVNPKVQVFSSYTGDWNDIGKAKEAALAHIAKGADIIWPILDHALLGVFDAAKEKKVYALGFTGDQLDLAPKQILTSALQNIGTAMVEITKIAAAGKLQSKVYVFGLETPNATGVGRYNPIVPKPVRDKVGEVTKLFIAGKITRQ
jgi:basic membrane protein A and related proteins